GGGGSAQGYTVVGGDTCGSIADKLGVATSELLVANPSINDGCTNLQPGQVLAIPGWIVEHCSPVSSSRSRS
ncbi:MAG: LysM peptidoglycan-binding domain-containing protein, partial [Dehalococcoidia bacterium]|nr:LysM peptidoglycan-binding domain-containing protein [Dehalococcoidia bacterium]